MPLSRPALVLSIVLLSALTTLPACERPAPEFDHSITNAELAERIREGSAPIILDVRTAKEYRASHIPGSINLPHDQLPARLSRLQIATTEEVVVHCESGRRAAVAEEILTDAGYSRVRSLKGHMKGWRKAGLPTE